MSNETRGLTIFEKIFSVRNEGTRKVICFLGLKIRFRTPRLVYRELHARLEKQSDDLDKLNSLLKQQSQMFGNALNSKLKEQEQYFNNRFIDLLEQQSQSFNNSFGNRLEKQFKDLNGEVTARLEKQAKIFESKINGQNARYQTLIYKIYRYCPDDKRPLAMKDWFYEHTGEQLDLGNPQTYNQKIQWLKLYDSTPVKARLSDKYQVREWIKEKIGEEYLIPLLGVWDNFDDIDFNKLPDKFALKCNHGSGYNIIVKDKSKLDLAAVRRKVNTWMNEDYSFKFGFELQYTLIPRKIVIEQYIENKNDDLYDYKFWCFDGEVKYIEFISGRYTNQKKLAFYDINWQKQNFLSDRAVLDDDVIEKPGNFDLMVKLAETLSKGFNHVRVDFYDVNNKIYFGEMTFTTNSGVCPWQPKEEDLEFGKMIKLPIKD